MRIAYRRCDDTYEFYEQAAPSAAGGSATGTAAYTIPAPRLEDLWRRHAAAALAAKQSSSPPSRSPGLAPRHPESFSTDVAALLRRYRENAHTGLLAADKHTAHTIKLANHYATPPNVMAALHHAVHATVELFASPLNVHPKTQQYFSAYEEDRAFGAQHDAYKANLRTLGPGGAVLFNPEYEDQELLRAVQTVVKAAR